MAVPSRVPRLGAPRGARVVAAAAGCALALAACGASTGRAPTPPTSTSADAATPGSATPPDDSATARDISSVTVAQSIDGFTRPWDLRLLPDGTPLVTERPGQLSAVVDGQRQLVATVPDVVAAGEGGLMGLALDPRFQANRRIYLCHAAGSAGRVTDVRVVRYRLAESLDALSGGTPLVTGIAAGAGNRHLGCRVEFGPDGMLWITTGDAVQPDAPQDASSLAGKVLRARPDGRPAADNPAGRGSRYVYTLGHRNVQGLAFRPSDGAAFAVEHGTDCDDEINVLRPGGNYGWDPVGPGGGYAERAPMTSPAIDGARAAVWSSGCPTIAPSGSDFVSGEAWGRWDGALAVAVLKDQELLLVELDGQTVRATRTVLAGRLGRLRTVRPAPDGSLWVTVDADAGSVVRVEPVT